jgi:hypothetical protein
MATKFYNPENNILGVVSNGHTNGYVNGTEDPRPLNIAIVGAGIGGLAAAIGLRKNGHHVSVNLTYNSKYAELTSTSYTSNLNSRVKLVLPSIWHPTLMAFSDDMVSWPRTLEQWKCVDWQSTTRRESRHEG